MTSSRAGGFAYLWTLMLIGFMGVATVIASELYATSMRRDRERELLSIGREFRGAIEQYYKAGAGGQPTYPLTLEELLKDPRFPGTKRHLRRLYRDPMTGRPDWGIVLQQGRIVGVHSLSNAAPLKQDNFDDSEAAFRHKARYSEWRFVYPPDLFIPPQGEAAVAPSNKP
jgi:type II secretory pathway pseudopilin PulG